MQLRYLRIAVVWATLGKEYGAIQWEITFLKTKLHLKGEVNSEGHNIQRFPIMEVNEVGFIYGVVRINVTSSSCNSICVLIPFKYFICGRINGRFEVLV